MPSFSMSSLPARDRSPRREKVRLIVVHVNVGPEKENVALGLGALTQRQTGAYHEIVDDAHVVVTAQDDEVVAGAAGANADGWHICLAGMPDQTAAQWADDYSTKELQIAAVRVAAACKRFGIPAVRLSPLQVAAGAAGICGHVDVSAAFHKSTHWDPGPNFPWPSFVAQVTAALNPAPAPTPDTEELDMTADEVKLLVVAGVQAAFDALLHSQDPTWVKLRQDLRYQINYAVDHDGK